MIDFSAERALLSFVLLNLAVYYAAWLFASRCVSRSRSQAILDAALLGYGVQYAAVGVPALLHLLTFASIATVAFTFSLMLAVIGWRTPEPPADSLSRSDRTVCYSICFFVLVFVLLFAHSQANLPVISNDAMTYHFPAAVQWLEHRRIDLFQTWFFNPANTYSPLAGSIFITWMIAPFHSDVLARFVEIPPLLCVGIAMYQLCRQVGTAPKLAALVAGSAVLARPIFLPGMMGKDDLFVVLFFGAALIALAPDRSRERLGPVRFGPVRFGLALGLLLATKYTALLTVPILLLALDGPKWKLRDWSAALLTALVIVGPWYLRNLVLTGNPIFPMFSQFTTAPSSSFSSCSHAINVLIGGNYGLPIAVAIATVIAWFLTLARAWSNPIHRVTTIGIPLGLLLYFLRSPFPEVRFVLPIFLLLFACFASCIQTRVHVEMMKNLAGAILLLLCVLTVFGTGNFIISARFVAISVGVTAVGLLALLWTKNRSGGRALFVACATALAVVYTYIYWAAYCRTYRETLHDRGGGYAVEYPDLNNLWQFVDEHIPADATIAYTNMYLVYPLQGPSLERRLLYVPTRAGMHSIADLGWLGRNLTGEQLIPAAVRATVASPDQATWFANLRKSKAKYLIVGKGGLIGTAPEMNFAAADSAHFQEIFNGPAGSVFRFEPS